MKRLIKLLKAKTGVSLVIMIVTLVIMLMIIGTIVFSLINVSQSQKADKLYSSLNLMKEKTNLYYLRHGELPVKRVYEEPLNIPTEILNPNDSSVYYVLDTDLMGEDEAEEGYVYIVNEATRTVYAIEQTETDEKTYTLPENNKPVNDNIRVNYEYKIAGEKVIIYIRAEELIDGIKEIEFPDGTKKQYPEGTKTIEEQYVSYILLYHME